MWLTKLAHDRLRIITDRGPQYVRLSFAERLRAAWVFRNFSILPQQVLSARERRWFCALCSDERASDMSVLDKGDGLIGTLEQ